MVQYVVSTYKYWLGNVLCKYFHVLEILQYLETSQCNPFVKWVYAAEWLPGIQIEIRMVSGKSYL